MSKLLLECDAAYAIDYLSILHVKANKLSGQTHYQNFDKCFDQLSKQVGKAKFWTIFQSREYSDLYNANLAVFNAVEKVRTNQEITAKEIDDLNLLRFKGKQALQEKFFKSGLIESKT